MKKEILYDQEKDEFVITLHIPKTMKGEYTYDDGYWEQDAVAVFIMDSHQEYTLNHTQYLDYKDSLQCTQPIIYFDSKNEALEFAKKWNLMVEYAH